MGALLVSLSQLQEVSPKNMILLVGSPGAGKSTFCHQAVLRNIELRPVIYVTTESSPIKVEESLRKIGLGEVSPHPLGFVDAFHETVGIPSKARHDTINSTCEDLTSLSIAIAKSREKMQEKALLVFDSLTSPYVFNGPEILRFMRQTISKFAAEGNAVLACIDEGCGKSEDMVSMMSSADGIVKIDLNDSSRTFNVIKHPKVKPTRIEVPIIGGTEIPYQYDVRAVTQFMEMSAGLKKGSFLRTEVGDYVNLFWPNFARWCGMLWDPKRFPTLTYNATKYGESVILPEFFRLLSWRMRLLFKFMPKDFSKVKNMKKLLAGMHSLTSRDRSGIDEYLEHASKTNEHYVRYTESAESWGFENVGAKLALGVQGSVAGVLRAFEKYRGGPDRDWNIVETKCVGAGDPYCELRIVPGEIDELKDSLEAIDNTILERIHERIMHHLMGYILHGKPLMVRPTLGSDISLHWFGHIIGSDAATASERYRIAMRMGGTMGGKKVGESLLDSNLSEDTIVKRILNFLEYCKVGKLTFDETIKIAQNCESFIIQSKEPSCHFTTGFFNGFFSAVKNQHVKETKCIAMGDPYCEWEFR
jgi:predicted hydrocarbon binding protein/KaiC/GvpD/RAD55 family RecA-like ATPase